MLHDRINTYIKRQTPAHAEILSVWAKILLIFNRGSELSICLKYAAELPAGARLPPMQNFPLHGRIFSEKIKNNQIGLLPLDY